MRNAFAWCSLWCSLWAAIGCGSSTSSVSAASVGKSATPTNYRVDNSACLTTAPAGDGACGDSCPTGAQYQCTTDANCTAGTNGRCIDNAAAAGNHCTYDQCAYDSDCPADHTCACRGSAYLGTEGNTCVPGNCHTDSDCGATGWCSPASSTDVCGDSLVGYYCHTTQDTCTNDGDCKVTSGSANTAICAWSEGSWSCENATACK